MFASVYTVKPEEQSVELFLGSYYSTGEPGLNFAPWPLVTAEVVNVTSERTEEIGRSVGGREEGLMLTTDANIVDIEFQVVWNVADPAKLLFNIRDPQLTVQAAGESVMREIIAASNLGADPQPRPWDHRRHRDSATFRRRWTNMTAASASCV